MGSFSIWHWLIVLLVVVLIFGGAVKGFKDGVRDGGAAPGDPAAPPAQVNVSKADESRTVDVDAKTKS